MIGLRFGGKGYAVPVLHDQREVYLILQQLDLLTNRPGVTPSARAAAVTDPRRPTASNACKARRGGKGGRIAGLNLMQAIRLLAIATSCHALFAEGKPRIRASLGQKRPLSGEMSMASAQIDSLNIKARLGAWSRMRIISGFCF